MNLKTLSLINLGAAILGFAPTALHAQAFIVPNGVTMQPNNGVRVIQNPSDGNYTGFFLYQQTPTTFLFSSLADEGVRVFQVTLNDPLSPQTVLASAYPELTFPNIYNFANGSSFYLGFYTGNSFAVNGVYADPLFAWGRFRNNNGTIQLLDSALEYGGGGIIAGTQTILPVPEPSLVVLVAVGACAFGILRWRRLQTTHMSNSCPQ